MSTLKITFILTAMLLYCYVSKKKNNNNKIYTFLYISGNCTSLDSHVDFFFGGTKCSNCSLTKCIITAYQVEVSFCFAY